MAATFTNLVRDNAGSQFKVAGTLTLDSSYPTSGEQISASTVGLAYFEDIDVRDSEGYTFDADIATGGATALIKAYYADYSTSTDGALIEVANTADLSAVVVNVVMFGK